MRFRPPHSRRPRDYGGAAAATSTYKLDRNDRATNYIDGNGNEWIMTFTGADAPLTIRDPLCARARTATSANNCPQHCPDGDEPKARRTSFAYDSLGRIVDIYNGDCGLNRNPSECGPSPASQRQ